MLEVQLHAVASTIATKLPKKSWNCTSSSHGCQGVGVSARRLSTRGLQARPLGAKGCELHKQAADSHLSKFASNKLHKLIKQYRVSIARQGRKRIVPVTQSPRRAHIKFETRGAGAQVREAAAAVRACTTMLAMHSLKSASGRTCCCPTCHERPP